MHQKMLFSPITVGSALSQAATKVIKALPNEEVKALYLLSQACPHYMRSINLIGTYEVM